jgi:formamidopyrimidine-DNA glycosylase
MNNRANTTMLTSDSIMVFLLRYHDPRRFGSMHWLDDASHMLLDHLGPEPLSTEFSADYLYRTSRKRSAPVKHVIMDAKVVVGVGNIYANEALFMAGIRPDRAANKISKARYELLVEAIKQVLATAIEVGGTTLRDFVGGDGKAGYFAQSLQVYGRAGEPCKRCKDQTLKEIRQSNRHQRQPHFIRRKLSLYITTRQARGYQFRPISI